jgi:hypothetical protein
LNETKRTKSRELNPGLLALGLFMTVLLGCKSSSGPSAPSWTRSKVLADDTNIYYFEVAKNAGFPGPIAIWKVSKNGGPPIELDRGDAGWTKYLAADEKQIYFTDISKVYALPK